MSKVIKNSETISDDNGIELLVGYEYQQSASQVEECHGLHEVGQLVETTLTSVEVVIAGIGIEILPRLNKRQREQIIDKLNYSN
jgi:hypothetical protein